MEQTNTSTFPGVPPHLQLSRHTLRAFAWFSLFFFIYSPGQFRPPRFCVYILNPSLPILKPSLNPSPCLTRKNVQGPNLVRGNTCIFVTRMLLPSLLVFFLGFVFRHSLHCGADTLCTSNEDLRIVPKTEVTRRSVIMFLLLDKCGDDEKRGPEWGDKVALFITIIIIIIIIIINV